MRRLAGILLAVAVVAGCGGGDERLSKEAYQSEVRKVGATLGEALGGVDTESGDLAAVGTQVDELQAALNTAADDLDALAPPEDVEGAHEKLVEGIRGFAADLEELGTALDRRDVGAVTEFERTFTSSESVQRIREAAQELQAKGYSLE